MFFWKTLESVKNDTSQIKISVQELRDDLYSELKSIDTRLENLSNLINVVLGIANSGNMPARPQPSNPYIGQVVESLPEPPTALTGRRNATDRNR